MLFRSLQARVQRLDELIVVPLYPQYAMASTGTVEIALRRALAASDGTSRPWFGAVKVVPPFYNNGAYLNALATVVGRHWTKDIQFILFSYHGLPKRHLIKTDPTHAHCLSSPLCCQTRSLAHVRCYRHQVIETTKGVADRIALPPDMHGISFQSRLGRGWLEPFTDVELELLPKRGIASLAVVCPAFVSDCLETLEEIAMRGREIFLRAGGSAFTYIPCLNDDPVWIEALASICEAAAAVAA